MSYSAEQFERDLWKMLFPDQERIIPHRDEMGSRYEMLCTIDSLVTVAKLQASCAQCNKEIVAKDALIICKQCNSIEKEQKKK